MKKNLLCKVMLGTAVLTALAIGSPFAFGQSREGSKPVARRGGAVGNGGDVVACWSADGALSRIELLDYYEGKTRRGLQVDLGAADLNVAEKVDLVLRRIERLDLSLATRLRARTTAFLGDLGEIESGLRGDLIAFTDEELVDVPDSQHISIPKGCSIVQIAIQSPPQFPEDRFYTVSRPLWNALSNNDRAGLILHEAIYSESIARGHETSKESRYFNSKIADSRFDQLSMKDYASLLEIVRYRHWNLGGIRFQLNGLQFGESGSVRGVTYRDEDEESPAAPQQILARLGQSDLVLFREIDAAPAALFGSKATRSCRVQLSHHPVLTPRGLETLYLGAATPAFELNGREGQPDYEPLPRARNQIALHANGQLGVFYRARGPDGLFDSFHPFRKRKPQTGGWMQYDENGAPWEIRGSLEEVAAAARKEDSLDLVVVTEPTMQGYALLASDGKNEKASLMIGSADLACRSAGYARALALDTRSMSKSETHYFSVREMAPAKRQNKRVKAMSRLVCSRN